MPNQANDDNQHLANPNEPGPSRIVIAIQTR